MRNFPAAPTATGSRLASEFWRERVEELSDFVVKADGGRARERTLESCRQWTATSSCCFM